MKLFDVTTVLKQYDGCKDVGFHWFRDDKPEGRPYAELISGYDPEFSFAPEERIDELFTEDEAAQLKAHLDQQYGKAGVTTITEAALPIANNQTGAGSIAVGGGNDFLRLRSFLPFKVRADERRNSRRPPRCPLQAHLNADRRPRCLAGGASGTRRGSSSWRAPKREGSGSSGGRWSWRNGCAGEEEEDDGRIESVTAARRRDQARARSHGRTSQAWRSTCHRGDPVAWPGLRRVSNWLGNPAEGIMSALAAVTPLPATIPRAG